MIINPCISICKTAPVSGFCYGCGRTNEDKKNWKSESCTDEWKQKNLKEIQERLKGLFSEEIGTTSELVFVKRIDIDGEVEASTFSLDYKEGKNITSLINEYDKQIQLQEIGWRVKGYVGTDMPFEVNSLLTADKDSPTSCIPPTIAINFIF